MKNICENCGIEIDREMNSCPNCGAKLGTKSSRRLTKFIAVFIVILLLIMSVYAYFIIRRVENFYEPDGIDIDGDFRDWQDISPISDNKEVIMFNPNVDIIEYRIDGRSKELSFYMEVSGEMLGGEPDGKRLVDTVYYFIDTDLSPSTGFFIHGIGADYMIEVYGWDSKVLESGLFSYSSNKHDWDLWEYEGSVDAKVSGSKMETQVIYKELGLVDQDTVDALFYTRSWDGFEDKANLVVSNEQGILQVTQEGIGSSVINGPGNNILYVKIKAWITDIFITEIKLKRIGFGTDNDISRIRLEDSRNYYYGTGTLSNGIVTFQTNIHLSPKQIRGLIFSINVNPEATAGNSIGLRIENNHDITISNGTVSVSREKTVGERSECSYIISHPDDVKIDGAYADWEGKHIRNDTSEDVYNSNLDILKYGVSSSDEGTSFYLWVNGIILSGDPIPHINEISESGIIPDDDSPKTGEDIIYIFIDTVNNSGFNLNQIIQADYLIEIKGRHNQIISSIYYEWSGTHLNDWTWIEKGPLQAGLDTDQMEVSIGWSNIGVDPLVDNFKVYFLMTNWREESFDYSQDIIIGPAR
jgi:uncharacterized protein YuzB (UPF0349 family)